MPTWYDLIDFVCDSGLTSDTVSVIVVVELFTGVVSYSGIAKPILSYCFFFFDFFKCHSINFSVAAGVTVER